MRFAPRTLAATTAVAAVGALALASCVGSTPAAAPSSGPTATASGTTLPLDVDCSTVTVDEDAKGLPTIKDDPSTVASVTWPKGAKAPTSLVSKTLSTGEGATVAEDSLVTVDYVGWQWGKTDPFDTSATHGSSFTTALNHVVSGWRCGLAGHKAGERVLLAVPAEMAYGYDTQSGAPTGPLVFVVDIKDASSVEDLVAGTKDAVPQDPQALSDRGITVTGELGSSAAITVASGATEPTKPEVIVVARGTGKALTADDTIMVNMAVTTWDGKQSQSTWEAKEPQTITLSQTSGLEGLVGVPVGSRVVLLLPGSGSSGSAGQSQATPAQAYVWDIEKAL